MSTGSVVFSTDQGLGILAKQFYDAGVVTDVVVLRHGRRPEHDEWYPNAHRLGMVSQLIQSDTLDWISSMDAMLFFETPFEWRLFELCKKMGVKTVLMPMHECEPDPLPARPDLMLCPSLLDFNCYDLLQGGGCSSVFLPIPVNVPWRLRTRATTFVHNAGNGGLQGRNGTKELIEAMRLTKSDARLILTSQVGVDLGTHNQKIEFRGGTRKYDEVWKDGGVGDVFVFPERFNGVSLPLQEARAAGMLVMGANRFPMNTWLPTEPLIPVAGYRKSRVARRCREFDDAIIEPQAIADCIDSWYNVDITEYSIQGKEWAQQNSWDVLKPKYTDLLEQLCNS